MGIRGVVLRGDDEVEVDAAVAAQRFARDIDAQHGLVHRAGLDAEVFFAVNFRAIGSGDAEGELARVFGFVQHFDGIDVLDPARCGRAGY